MLHLFPLIRSSFRDLTANKLRSFLTMLGIIIGIASVILVMAIGEGAQELIVSQVSKIGTNIIGVLPGKSEWEGPPISAMGVTITSLKKEDAEAMKSLPHIEAATPYATGRATISYGKEAHLFDFVGVSSDYTQVEETSIKRGYFFSKDQQRSFSKVAVLGHEVAQELFKNENPLSKKIRIKGRTFKVIGVLEKRGSTFFGNLDNQVFLPITTTQKDLLGINHVNYIRAKVSDSSQVEVAQKEIEELLRHRHNVKDPEKDDFTVRSMDQLLSILGNVTGAVQAFLVLVVMISLIVGGIGIMNIMLASLSERIREVGLRKAVGARDRDVLIQFLSESSLLSLIGGTVGIFSGIGLGMGIAYLIRLFTGFEWYFIITSWEIALAVIVALIIGIIFGLYPARKAAQLDPIDALHYE